MLNRKHCITRALYSAGVQSKTNTGPGAHCHRPGKTGPDLPALGKTTRGLYPQYPPRPPVSAVTTAEARRHGTCIFVEHYDLSPDRHILGCYALCTGKQSSIFNEIAVSFDT